MLIDTHAHLNFSAFNKDRDKIIKKCLDNNVWVVNVGTNLITSKQVVELALKYEKGIYASIGLHPINLETGLVKIKADINERKSIEKEFDYEKYKKLAQNEKVVAIGEIGLDYYWRPKTKVKKELFKQKQKDLLLEQLKLAKELDLPVIFHCRMANHDLFNILSDHSDLRPKKAVAHSFVGSVDDIRRHIDLGYYIGFNGIIFKNIEGIDFKEIIKATPSERILIETDCPYLVPPQAQTKRNEPIFVKYIAQEIAKIKSISFEKVKEAITKNAKTLFGI
ncbi:MAG: TatD family hydrolase [Patescibacteria group bacterium]|nr:TatD family hydrolase [Patescibacteria group bacterium]